MNKTNKQNKIFLKKHFTKDQLLILKKYNRLLTLDISYAVINRAYKRYIKNIDEFILKTQYPKYWFSTNRDMFCIAIRSYIAANEEGYEFKPHTRGWTNKIIAELSEIDKYLNKT